MFGNWNRRLGIASLGLASVLTLMAPVAASAGDRDDYYRNGDRGGYAYGYEAPHHEREWRDRERHEWREQERRERQWREHERREHERDYRYNRYDGYRDGYYNPYRY